jgi:hypothetical protein
MEGIGLPDRSGSPCGYVCKETEYVEVVIKRRPGWLLVSCVKCGRWIGYKPEVVSAKGRWRGRASRGQVEGQGRLKTSERRAA